jgi:hypothetical protein
MLIPRRGRDKDDPKAEQPPDSDLARRVLAHASSPEEKLEQLLAARSRELEEQARRFEEVMGDLERREALLRDMRTSVERLLRLGTKDLTEREVELQELGREFMEREARLSAEEAELNRRRSELGAVELKREALEQRERALAAREQELDAAAASEPGPTANAGTHGSEASEPRSGGTEGAVTVLFVPGATYRLVEVARRSLAPGAPVEIDGEPYVVSRIGRAPLPGDARTCAYLERSGPGSSAPGGSS